MSSYVFIQMFKGIMSRQVAKDDVMTYNNGRIGQSNELFKRTESLKWVGRPITDAKANRPRPRHWLVRFSDHVWKTHFTDMGTKFMKYHKLRE